MINNKNKYIAVILQMYILACRNSLYTLKGLKFTFYDSEYVKNLGFF